MIKLLIAFMLAVTTPVIANYPILETGGGGVAEYETTKLYTEGTIVWDTTDFYKTLNDYTSITLETDRLNGDLIKMVDPLDYLVGLTGNVQVQLDATNVRIDTNETDIAANVVDIANNAANISSNNTNIQTNATSIANNATNINTNTTDIATNVTDIASNTTDIGTNTSNIATNAADITTNAADIAANTSDISAIVSADGSVGTHSDVTLTSPVDGESLVHNGTAFVNKILTADEVPESAPPEVLALETFSTPNSNFGTSGTWYGTTFLLSADSTISKVGMVIGNNGSATGTIRFAIYDTVSGVPTNRIGQTIDINPASDIPAGSGVGAGFSEFAMENPLVVTSGTYAIFADLSGLTSGTMQLGVNSSNPYADGQLYQSSNNGASFSTFSSGQFDTPARIYTQGQPNNKYFTSVRANQAIAAYLEANPQGGGGAAISSNFSLPNSQSPSSTILTTNVDVAAGGTVDISILPSDDFTNDYFIPDQANPSPNAGAGFRMLDGSLYCTLVVRIDGVLVGYTTRNRVGGSSHSGALNFRWKKDGLTPATGVSLTLSTLTNTSCGFSSAKLYYTSN